MTEQDIDYINLLQGIIITLPRIYASYGLESKTTIKIRQIIDVMITKCYQANKEASEALIQYYQAKNLKEIQLEDS